MLIALLFLGAFIWANKNGQHDDTYTPAIRILFDDGITANENPLSEEPVNTPNK